MARSKNSKKTKKSKEDKIMVDDAIKDEAIDSEKAVQESTENQSPTIEPVITNDISEDKKEATVEPEPKDSPKPKAMFNDPMLDQYFKEYVDAINAKDVKKAAASLRNIVNLVIRKPDTKHMNALFNFFNKYKDSILVESAALQGIATIEPTTRAKIEIIYTIMRTITKYPQRKDKINWDVARQILGDKVTNWLISKIKSV